MTDDIEIAKLRDLQQHPHRHESDTIYIIPRLPSCFALLVSYFWCGHAQIGLCVDFRSRAASLSTSSPGQRPNRCVICYAYVIRSTS